MCAMEPSRKCFHMAPMAQRYRVFTMNTATWSQTRGNHSSSFPPFVKVPQFLLKAAKERLEPTDDGLSQLLNEMNLDRPLHFSNGGGVYLLSSTHDGKQLVMKEGRAYAGWDFRGVDAFRRVENEYATLLALASTGATPQPNDLKVIGDHAFLIEEYIEGDNLFTWVSKNYPFSYRYETSTYAKRALEVLRELDLIVRKVHESGFAVVDLQPTNIIVTPDNCVRLIDMESCCSINEPHADSYIGTPGYVPQTDHSARQRDEYALLQIAFHLFYPLSPLPSLSDSVLPVLLDQIKEIFPREVSDEIRRRMVGASGVVTTNEFDSYGIPLASGVNSAGTLVDEVTAGMRLVRRNKRLSSSDPSAYPLPSSGISGVTQLSIEHGLAGVMLALGPDDINATEDLKHLAHAANQIDIPSPGFLNGILGTAVTLASRGEEDLALDLYNRASTGAEVEANISIRSGKAGRLVGQLHLASKLRDDCLLSDTHQTIDQLVSLISEPPETLISPGRMASRALGLIDGWSGVALALSMAAEHFREPELHSHARRAIGLDTPNLIEAPDGSLQGDDGFRMLPYLGDGSGGVGIALSSIPQAYRHHGDNDTLARIALAVRARTCISADLLHGRAGLLLTLASIDVDSIDGVPIETVLREQFNLLAPFLFRVRGEKGTLVSAADNTRFGLDLGAGASGVAYTLRELTGTNELSALGSLADRRYYRARRALGTDLTVSSGH